MRSGADISQLRAIVILRCVCRRFHHQPSLSPAKRRGRKKNILIPPSPFLPGIPISPCSLSSTFVDKSHICVPFWRLLIVLNRHNYYPGPTRAGRCRGVGGQTERWKSLASCFVNRKYPLPPFQSQNVSERSPPGSEWRITSTLVRPYFIFCTWVINLRTGLHLSLPPSTRRFGTVYGALVCSGYLLGGEAETP